MNPDTNSINELAAAQAFNKQSIVFDQLYSSNPVIGYKRQRVRDHIMQYLKPGSDILELNAGTGEDALWFARQGHNVHATDISEGMQKILAQKADEQKLSDKISYELCSFTQLNQLQNKGPYDFIFSNFAGLNCTGEPGKVLSSFAGLLKPGGMVTLVLLPGFCLWEFLLLFKGRFKTAFRRFFSKKGVKAHIEGIYFTCWYYNPSYITRKMKDKFDVLGIEGLCTLVPPSYIENFPVKYPRLFHWLKQKEDRIKNRWPWKNIGDYYIITLKMKTG